MDVPQEAKRFVMKLDLHLCRCDPDSDEGEPCYRCKLTIRRLTRLLYKAIAVE